MKKNVAMVFAYENGHQSANHVAAGERNQVVGAIIGAVLLGAVGALASYRSPNSGNVTQAAIQTGGDLGGAIGAHLIFQGPEREADYLSAVILYRSGMDLDKARGFLLTMARASGRRETGMLDTHPAGPDASRPGTRPSRRSGRPTEPYRKEVRTLGRRLRLELVELRARRRSCRRGRPSASPCRSRASPRRPRTRRWRSA